MEVNNFKIVRSLLDFSSSDDFYFLQILKRKKENPEVPSNHNNNKRSIRTYYIPSLDYFNSIEDEVKAICLATNSRAYIHPTKRSYKRVGKYCAITVMERVFNEEYTHIYKAFNTACGREEGRGDRKLWIVDIDVKDLNVVKKYESLLLKELVETIPTKNGYHLITIPFRVDTFLQNCAINKLENPDIQKNNPTLLYYSDGKEKPVSHLYPYGKHPDGKCVVCDEYSCICYAR